MMHRRERRRLLSPVLADEPLVGEGLTRRVRIVLLCILALFVLTNVTSYLIGQAVRAEADRRTRQHIANLERQVAADIEARRAANDREQANLEQANAQLRQELERLHRDLCVALDRLPRDAQVNAARRRHGCVGGTAPTGNRDAASPQSPSGPAGGTAGTPRPRPGPSGPPGTPGPTAPPSSPPPDDDGGLVCLPIVGCLL